MIKEYLISELRTLGVSCAQIERDNNMPTRQLHRYVKDPSLLPDKWVDTLTNYVRLKKGSEGMTKEELIAHVKTLGFSCARIERDNKMPSRQLYRCFQKPSLLPNKWVDKLTTYVRLKKESETKTKEELIAELKTLGNMHYFKHLSLLPDKSVDTLTTYVRLVKENVALRKNIRSLETQVNKLKMENIRLQNDLSDKIISAKKFIIKRKTN